MMPATDILDHRYVLVARCCQVVLSLTSDRELLFGQTFRVSCLYSSCI